MKKLFKTLALLVVTVALCIGVVAFAGCGGGDKTYNGTYVGEYSYTSSGTNYGIKVSVEVEDNVIKSVTKLDSDYVEVTSAMPEYGWTEEKVTVWNNGLDNLLASYTGKTVAEIKAIKVTVKDSGEPSLTAENFDGLVITGATVGSGRVLLAVQNALK